MDDLSPKAKDDDNVKVAVRCRPFNKREKKLKSQNVIEVDTSTTQITLTNAAENKAKSFRFDYVYGDGSSQKDVYEDTAYPLVESVLEGYNGTIFAYGQTGCGKTWTMEGPNNGDVTLQGIIPSSFQHIFDRVDSESDPNTKFLIRAGYIEIYNEEIRDLLSDDPLKKMNLREDPDKGVYVQNLCMKTVKNVNDTQTLMDKGRKSRVTGSTKMNALSSRSHAIFVLNVETSSMIKMADPNDKNKMINEQKIKAGKLNLVDLAGSERQSKTGAQGMRFKEATKINLSLSALGNVISALVEGRGKHIPYRDSKLTRLLQDSLGGNTKTVMIACISPAADNYDETLSTLRYANRAKNIKNKPKINEDPKDALLKEYQDEIKRLKEMLKGSKLGKMIKQKSIKSSPETRIEIKEKVVTKTVIDETQIKKLKQKLAQQQNVIDTIEEKRDDDMMEELYLLESQLLDGGDIINSAKNQAKKRLDEMKKSHQKKRRQKRKNKDRAAKTYKIKYKEAQSEIEDLMSEFEKQRSDLLQDVRTTYREMLIYRAIVCKLMDASTIDDIMYQSQWNEQRECWVLPNFMNNHNRSHNHNHLQQPQSQKNNVVSTPRSHREMHSKNENLPLSVQQHLDEMDWNKSTHKESFFQNNDDTESDALNKQTMDNFDLSQMQNQNEFENIESNEKKNAMISKNINIDDHFIEQISKIDQDNEVFTGVGVDGNDKMKNEIKLISKDDIQIEDDFIAQLSKIENVDTFGSHKLDENEQDMMDIANLMITDKQRLQSPQQQRDDDDDNHCHVLSDDDILKKMMQMNDSPKQTNLFLEHKGALQEKQDVDDDLVGDFFDVEDGEQEQAMIDITELHKVLNKRSR